jgi:hypothetical protein
MIAVWGSRTALGAAEESKTVIMGTSLMLTARFNGFVGAGQLGGVPAFPAYHQYVSLHTNCFFGAAQCG